MVKIFFEGTVRTVEHVERHKKDLDMDFDRLVVRDEDGVNQIIVRSNDIDGFSPEMSVKVTIETTQKTLKEATK